MEFYFAQLEKLPAIYEVTVGGAKKNAGVLKSPEWLEKGEPSFYGIILVPYAQMGAAVFLR